MESTNSISGWLRLFACLLGIVCTLFTIDMAMAQSGPPLRSTYYDGTSQVSYEHRPEYSLGDTLTIEAWVYREDDERCEAILSNDFRSSFWLGFCPDLRLYVLGTAVTIDKTVPAGQWTHVAATYDGLLVHFYIDGELASRPTLVVTGTPPPNTLIVGGDHNLDFISNNFNFQGSLDEVRLWSVVRTEAEIRAGMFSELRGEENLVAAFGNGGGREEINSVSGTPSGAPTPQIEGLLPRNLVIPESPIAPILDGDVNLLSEYIAAEQLVIRYKNGALLKDISAHINYKDDNLYLGFQFPEIQGDVPYNDASLVILLDTTNNLNPTAEAVDIQLQIPLAGSSSPRWLVGDGDGGYVPTAVPPAFGANGLWDVSFSFCVSEFAPPCVEVRINETLLGSFSEIDRMAIGHRDLALDGTPADFLAPGDIEIASPATWPEMSYGGLSAELPRAYFSGFVRDVALGDTIYIPDYEVFLYAGTSLLDSTRSDADGTFEFSNIPVPKDTALKIQLSDCSGCLYEEVFVNSSGIQATETSPLVVTFPGCADETCGYAAISFSIIRPDSVGAVSLTSYEPEEFILPTPLRMDNSLTAGGFVPVTIQGENLHSRLEFFLFKTGNSCEVRPPTEECARYPVEVIERTNGGSSVTVQWPTGAEAPPAGAYFFGAYDSWRRPGNTSAVNSWQYGPQFGVNTPTYPELYGFGFENAEDSPSIDQFLSIYGRNAYHCPGPWIAGRCTILTPIPVPTVPIPEPRYWAVWYPIFHYWIEQTNRSCVGMASTSQLMHDGFLPPATFDDNVLYPAGFTEFEQENFVYDKPLGRVAGPPTPGNLWAHIRRNHGIQTTVEYLAYFLVDADELVFGPNRALSRLSENPTAHILCMQDDGSGHCVSPYNLESIDLSTTVIKVYDNSNDQPLNSTLPITVTRTTNEYIFPRPYKSDDEGNTRIYDGGWMQAVPLSLWKKEGGYNMPDRPGVALTTMAIFGDSDALVEMPSGERWGWTDADEFVEEIPNAVTVAAFGQVDDSRNALLLLPNESSSPRVTAASRGGDYLFFATGTGTTLQLIVPDSGIDEKDQIELVYEEDDTLDGFYFTPQEARDAAIPRIGLSLGISTSLALTWQNLTVPQGSKVGFIAEQNKRGARFVNEGDSTVEHSLIVQAVDEATAFNSLFGPIQTPAGATHRLAIEDWPRGDSLLVELDSDGDGIYEQSETLSAQACPPQDLDDDGFAETCPVAVEHLAPPDGLAPPDSRTTIYLPLSMR